jgi:hypothetical protein
VWYASRWWISCSRSDYGDEIMPYYRYRRTYFACSTKDGKIEQTKDRAECCQKYGHTNVDGTKTCYNPITATKPKFIDPNDKTNLIQKVAGITPSRDKYKKPSDKLDTTVVRGGLEKLTGHPIVPSIVEKVEDPDKQTDEEKKSRNGGDDDSGGNGKDKGDCPWGKNPASGCCNCDPKADALNKAGCKMGKLFGCEAGVAADNCMGTGIPCSMLAIGGLAAVVLIMVLK